MKLENQVRVELTHEEVQQAIWNYMDKEGITFPEGYDYKSIMLDDGYSHGAYIVYHTTE